MILDSDKPQIFEAKDHKAIQEQGRERHRRNNLEHGVIFPDEPLEIDAVGFVFDNPERQINERD